MITNAFIQYQINFNLVQINIYKSLSKRFIKRKNIQMIYDSIFINSLSNYEEYIILDAITLAYNQSLGA